jgi:replicative DNA helicase
MIERELPRNLDAERAVLGAVIVRNGVLANVSDVVKPEMFFRRAHQQVFQHMLGLDAKGLPIDPITLRESLTHTGELDEVGGPAALTRLVDGVPGNSNARHYAESIRQHWTLRQTIAACSETIAECYEAAPDEVEEIINRGSQRMFDVSCARAEDGFVPADALMKEAYALFQKWGAGQQTGIPTGFYALDRMTGGWQPGRLIVVAARPSMGKSSFVLNTGMHAALHGHPVGVFSVEMAKDEVGMRLLTAEARLDSQHMRTEGLNHTEFDRMSVAMRRIERCPFYVDDDGAPTVTDIRARARRLKSKHGIKLLVVDYLQLLCSEKNAENRNLEIAGMTRALKVLGKELELPVIVLSQLNRSVDTRQDHRPVLSDLRDSGAIEQDADIVLFLYRPEVYDTDDLSLHGKAELIIAKQRGGPTGAIPLTWLDYCTRFENYVEAA